MMFQYEIIYNEDLKDSDKSIFTELLKKQRKIKGNLAEKVDRCKMICIVTVNKQPIAIGGIKPKTKSDFTVGKADLQSLEKFFHWELGYLFTNENYSGKGIASTVVKMLITEFGSGNLMASTEITANPGMVKILENNGFKLCGKPWKSTIHDNELGLFLKFV